MLAAIKQGMRKYANIDEHNFLRNNAQRVETVIGVHTPVIYIQLITLIQCTFV